MDWREGSERVQPQSATDVSRASVRWKPKKSLWMGSMTAATLILGPLTLSWSAFAVFLLLTIPTLLAGHSVGLHRKLIHNSFGCPDWLENVFVYLGTLVGMDGPVGMMRQHDVRDWAQRVPGCHQYVRHGAPILQDYCWQVHCDVTFEHPPHFEEEPRVRNNRFIQFLEQTWMLQQLPIALVLFWLGGLPFVVWGVCARVTVGVTGHWLVGHLAHNEGPMRWRIIGAGVQGRDVPLAGLLSMGEGWHSNHHAYPSSAKLGLDRDQPDPGWWFLKVLEAVGLVSNLQTPETLPQRDALVRVSEKSGGCPAMRKLLVDEGA